MLAVICITIVAVILYIRYYKWICHEEANTEQCDSVTHEIDDTTINAFKSDVSSQPSVATPATSPAPSVSKSSKSSSRNNRSSRTYYDDDEDEYDEDGMYKDEDEDIKDKRQYDDYDDDEADDWE